MHLSYVGLPTQNKTETLTLEENAMKINEKNSNCTESSTHEQTGCCGDDAKIAELAYTKAENRGFEPGYELEDWLQAEQELALSITA